MAQSWSAVLTDLVPLGLVVALSPITVIPAVLVLQAPRPRRSGLAFLAGWVSGLAAVTALSAAGAGALTTEREGPPEWAAWMRVILGTVLILVGVYHWLTRRRHTDPPGWMRSFETITPPRAAITAVVLVLARPDVLLICLPAGLAIGTSGLPGAGVWIATAFFVMLASASVALPILTYAGFGQRLDRTLARLKTWMEANNAALLAVLLLVLGAMVLHHGIDGLHARR